MKGKITTIFLTVYLSQFSLTLYFSLSLLLALTHAVLQDCIGPHTLGLHFSSSLFFSGENSQIPRFGKICDKLTLFQKYLAMYYFFSTRFSQNRVLNSTRVH